MTIPNNSVDPYTQKCALFYWVEMSGQLAFKEWQTVLSFPVYFLPMCQCNSMKSADTGDNSRVSADLFANK